MYNKNRQYKQQWLQVHFQHQLDLSFWRPWMMAAQTAFTFAWDKFNANGTAAGIRRDELLSLTHA